MTSIERHEARYRRRKEKRLRKVYERSEEHTKDVFTPHELEKAYKKHRKRTGWKPSVKVYGGNLVMNCAHASQQVVNRKWRSKGFKEFDVRERGKLRHIMSTDVEEKCIQRALCDNCLIPILEDYLIYDNSATIKGKGTDFALDRLTEHLHRHYRKHGRKGGIYFFDFTNFFGSIDNVLLNDMVKKKIHDDLCLLMFGMFTFAFGPVGLGLGSQVSQISAVFFPNSVDHFIKDQCGIEGFGRYSDDGYIICEDIDRLKEMVKRFEEKCRELHISLNQKKCHIFKLTRPFKFLKVRFWLTETGKVLRRINRESVHRERQKLKKYRKFLIEGKMDIREIRLLFHSWLCSQKRGKSYHIIRNMIVWYNRLFFGTDTYYPPKPKKHKRIEFISRSVMREPLYEGWERKTA